MNTKANNTESAPVAGHTPGKWHLVKLAHPEKHRLTRLDYEIRPSDSHCSIAFLVIGQDASQPDQRAIPAEVEANARLIASAPALLEATKSLLELCEGGHGNALQRMDLARAALALAKGGAE